MNTSHIKTTINGNNSGENHLIYKNKQIKKHHFLIELDKKSLKKDKNGDFLIKKAKKVHFTPKR